ncbi:AraC-type DNA-binding protein [Chitinophaga eiseniae]|uniref:AraC-type DNA-binding protein n=2 Tax=Chitinophaga eiseniae TaxID=634771 RepID=A0A1T4MLU6_9BACT|nr:AraC-type DNA-binding protein [Chitinophaga eiseniae]
MVFHSMQLPAIRRYAARYKKGQMLFQCIEEDSDCSIWHNVFRLHETDTLVSSCQGPLLLLRVCLNGQFRFSAGGLGDFELAPGQAMLLFQPRPQSDLHLEGGEEYAVVDIVMPGKYMQHFLLYYAVLADFSEKITDQAAACLTTFPIRLPVTTLHGIDKLLNCTYMGTLRSMYVDARLMDIITEVLSLAEGNGKKEVSLSQDEIERILEIRKMLIENIDKHYRIKDLSKMAYMNEYKLKRGFQQIVGASIFDYQLNHRMQAAQAQLLGTEMSLEEITEATGYQHLSSFINAFRQHFGETPAAFRKNKRR